MAKKGEAEQINYDDPKYRITLSQQAAASCTGAVITSLIGNHIFVLVAKYIMRINFSSYPVGCCENKATNTTESVSQSNKMFPVL